jgi:hypothetical protein
MSMLKKAHRSGKEGQTTSPNNQIAKSPTHLHLRHGEDGKRSAEVAAVVLVLDKALAVGSDHVDGGLGRQTEPVDVGRVGDLVDVLLAVLSGDALLLVVAEERVRAGAVAPDAGAVDDAHGPGRSDALSDEVGVEVLVVLGEGYVGLGVGLVVGSLGLDGAVEDVLGALEVVLRHLGVLGGGAVEPDGTLRLDDHAAAVVDVDLTVILLVELVVSSPEPDVLEVAVGLLGDVELHEGTDALRVGGVGGVGVLCAVGRLELGALVTTDTEVDIPETSLASVGVDVPLHQDTTGSGALGTDDGVVHLEGSLVTRLGTDLETRLGVVHVAEELAGDEEHRVNLTLDLDVLLGRDDNGLLDEVGTVVDVEDLAVLETVDGSLDSSGVIGVAVALSTLGLEADELGDVDITVLGLAALEPAVVALEDGRLLGTVVDVTLDAALGGASSHSVTLSPGLDLGAALDKDVAGSADDSRLRAGEVNVLQDQSTTSHGDTVLSEGSVDTDGSVDKLAVEHEDGADGLVGGAVGHVETNLAVVDEDALHGPEPVPVHVDGGAAVVEGHVAGSELLRAEESTDTTTVEGEVSHETTGAVVLEDTLLVLAGVALGHLKTDVLERGGLRDLPVNTSGSLGSRNVNDEVADLTVEVVLVGEPVGTITTWDIRICVHDSHALEGGGSLDGGEVVDITNKLGVVVLDDGFAHSVGTSREVNDSRSCGRRVTALAASLAISNGLVDSRSVVSSTITNGTVVLDVTEDLVGILVGVVRRNTLALDVSEPVPSPCGRRRSLWCCDGSGCGGGCCDEHAKRQEQRTSAESHHDSYVCFVFG